VRHPPGGAADLRCCVGGTRSDAVVLKSAKIAESLRCVEAGDLTSAAQLLGTLIRGKRLVRASTAAAAPEEIDEVKTWLRRLIANPDAEDADLFLIRTYYKLRNQMPPEAAHR
jgi:hypothetical protein